MGNSKRSDWVALALASFGGFIIEITVKAVKEEQLPGHWTLSEN